jgi:hypothetical protein
MKASSSNPSSIVENPRTLERAGIVLSFKKLLTEGGGAVYSPEYINQKMSVVSDVLISSPGRKNETFFSAKHFGSSAMSPFGVQHFCCAGE